MSSVRSLVVAASLVAGAAGPAHALKPATHADISFASCKAAGLPADFCRRVATEDYNTDANEWDDLAAHAQIDANQTSCAAADITASRVYHLAADVRRGLADLATNRSYDVGEIGTTLGRLVHTVQDNCAHHGMPNTQHAWFSLGDFCEGTKTSPDLDPAAVTCARAETDAIMRAVAAAVRDTGSAALIRAGSCPDDSFNDNSNQQNICDRRALPAPWEACSFLAEAKQWDGIDRTWNNKLVVAGLRDAAARGLSGNTHGPGSICAGREDALSPAVSESVVDVSQGAPSCTQAHLLCAGKVDGDVENPFDGDLDDGLGGCAVGSNSHVCVALVLGALVLRRRRSSVRTKTDRSASA